MHGGASTGAPIKTGRYSKFLPTRLAAKYEEAAADAELISLKDEAAVLQTFIAEALEGIDLEHCEAMWDTLKRLVEKHQSLGPTELPSWASEVCGCIRDGVEEWQQVHRVLGYIEAKRKVAESENKRLKDLEQNLNAKQANVLVAALTSAVLEEVHDSAVRARIQTKFIQLVHRAGSTGSNG